MATLSDSAGLERCSQRSGEGIVWGCVWKGEEGDWLEQHVGPFSTILQGFLLLSGNEGKRARVCQAQTSCPFSGVEGCGLKDSLDSPQDQPSLELVLGHCTLSGVPGLMGSQWERWQLCHHQQDMACLCSPEEATCPERLWAGRGSEVGWCHPGTHRLKDRVGIPGLGVPCSLEGSHCLSLSAEVAGGCPWA